MVVRQRLLSIKQAVLNLSWRALLAEDEMDCRASGSLTEADRHACCHWFRQTVLRRLDRALAMCRVMGCSLSTRSRLRLLCDQVPRTDTDCAPGMHGRPREISHPPRDVAGFDQAISAFRKLKIILLEQVSFAADVHQLPLTENIYLIEKKYPSAAPQLWRAQ